MSVPKCGTHSILKLFRDYYEGQQTHKGEKLHIHENIIPFDYAGYTVFTAVRNPYKRAISSWWSAKMNSTWKLTDTKNPATFLRDTFNISPTIHRIIPVHKQIKGIKGIKVFRLENIKEDLLSLSFYKGEDVPLENTAFNAQLKPPNKKIMSKRFISTVNRLYSKDFELGGYSKVIP